MDLPDTKPEIQNDVTRGAKAADYAWDNVLRRRSVAFLAGYVVKLYGLISVALTEDELNAFFGVVTKGIEPFGLTHPQRKN